MPQRNEDLPLIVTDHAKDESLLSAESCGSGTSLPAFIVGIGASAGGLEALERLFEHMPEKSGMAFVVLQHLSPDFKSLTDELLARRTRIPIHVAENGMVLCADTIYLLPPKKDMIVSEGALLLSDKDPKQGLTLPIDHFFRSLAQDARDAAVGIILSGTGSDGSRGIRDIRDTGGVVLAQSAESAKFDGMPRSAVATGAVNAIIAPEEMPEWLLRHANHPSLGEFSYPGVPPAPIVPESAMQTIFRLLRDEHGIDFSHYKPETVTRRIERRLQLSRVIDIEEYVKPLAEDPAELNRLYKDLLIGVTHFFRDAEAFRRLEQEILPKVLEGLPAGDELRVWVAGCATGEEAYSLAILIHEGFTALGRPVEAKIFATDVHRASIDFAGAGMYSQENLRGVNAERMERYFNRKGADYQISQDLRKLVVFAQHNLLKDAPFTRLDLISCRNLLIYFAPHAQRRVLSLFHFGLKPGGKLFLGPSESPGELSDEFDIVDARWKFYRKRRDIRLLPEVRLGVAERDSERHSPRRGEAWTASADAQLVGTYHALLEEYMPPSVLVNERMEVIHSFHGASQFLKLKEGRFSSEILGMVEGELRVALAGALQRVFRENCPVHYRGFRVQLPEGERLVDLSIKPVRGRREEPVNALIQLEISGIPPVSTLPQAFDFQQASQDQLQSLELELRNTKENLQATIEELETSNEELQATNEELVAANEELQSTNEELHSVNEELYTVNGEHQKKIAELTEMTGDMDNLLVSTQVHTIFLDRRLRIRKYTPMMAETFNLIPQDIGRRIDSFSNNLDYPALPIDLQNVLDGMTPHERQVCDRRGCWFLLRILPYHANEAIDGVVLTLVDIDHLKRAEAEARLKERYLTSILRTSPNFVFIKDLNRRYILADDAYRRVFGVDPIGKVSSDVYPPEIARAIDAEDERVLKEGASVESELVIPQADGAHTYLCVRFPLRDEQDRIIGISGIKTDVTVLKQAEQRAREAVSQRDRFLAVLSHELRNPLAAVLNAARVIDGVGAASPEMSQWVGVIERRAQHMARLLDDLLDVSRITRDRFEIRHALVDLCDTVRDVIEEVQPWLEERRIRLELSNPGLSLYVEGDADRLQQIQVNLLLNAAKYSPEGGTVWYEVSREVDEAVIRVRDTGCGIAPEMLEKIFQLFVQENDAVGRSKGGIGVGLTLVRYVVQLHGGSVRAHSNGPGTGSEFVVRLPLTSKAPFPTTASESALRRVDPPAADALQVLIVEDDPDICESMKALVEANGHTVATAMDGLTGLDLLERTAFDVALVDIGLPSIDGYEFARRVRARQPAPSIRLVAVTGYGRVDDQQAAREAGFDAHVTKPIRLPELYELLHRFAVPRSHKNEASVSAPSAVP